MAHFAYVVDGVVERVHVLANPVLIDEDYVEQEAFGQEFLSNLHGLPPENFVQCSYNANFRGNYPAVGFTYDSDLDGFIPPKPFPSWVLDEDTCLWVAPVPMPEDGGVYSWDEDAGDWVEVPGGS
jgi:hypothetical protein